MKKGTKIFWAIYLSGVIASYCYGKNEITRFEEGLNKKYPEVKSQVWTVRDRGFTLFMSLYSWLGVVGIGIADIIQNTNGDAKANW